MMRRILSLLILAFAAGSASAAHDYRGQRYEGILHNDSDAHRASLEANGRLYWLDFQGADLYHVAERYDRDRAIVHGSVRYPAAERRPVIYVDRITFRPYGRAVTYRVTPRYGERRYYSSYQRPVVRERTSVREYDY